METGYSKGELDEMINFKFKDPVDGYIELDMEVPQQRPCTGWTLATHKRPLRVLEV